MYEAPMEALTTTLPALAQTLPWGSETSEKVATKPIFEMRGVEYESVDISKLDIFRSSNSNAATPLPRVTDG